jgi:hypothetical protein
MDVFYLKIMVKVVRNLTAKDRNKKILESWESPFLLYVWCNRGATGIEIVDRRDTIDNLHPHK